MNFTRIYLLRVFRVLLCGFIICGIFYLYLPQSESFIEGMNDTVGIDRVDVLCLGSSHMCAGINPVRMYQKNGYATYTIWRGSQAPWQSYYYLKEACDYQKPYVVIMDVYMIGTCDDNGYEDYQTVRNLLDNPLSINKIDAVMASIANSRLDILLRFPYVHNDYGSFTGFTTDKFFGETDYLMGGESDNTVYVVENATDVSAVDELSEISPKSEKYLKKIIEWCNDKNIGLILVNAPSPMITEEEEKRYNHIGSIAADYGILFIDGNKLWDKLGMDWKKDCRDVSGHLNEFGITKFTSYVEGVIEKEYKIPDRRGVTGYEAYDEGVRLYGD